METNGYRIIKNGDDCDELKSYFNGILERAKPGPDITGDIIGVFVESPFKTREKFFSFMRSATRRKNKDQGNAKKRSFHLAMIARYAALWMEDQARYYYMKGDANGFSYWMQYISLAIYLHWRFWGYSCEHSDIEANDHINALWKKITGKAPEKYINLKHE